MQLRTVNFLLAIVTGRVWKGEYYTGKTIKVKELWDCEEALSFIYDHFITDIISKIINDDIKERIYNEYFRN